MWMEQAIDLLAGTAPHPNPRVAALVLDKDGKRVGFVTSGGYGHTVEKSLAMAMVDSDMAAEDTDLSVHIVGVERPAKVIAPSPYDPAGTAMRG